MGRSAKFFAKTPRPMVCMVYADMGCVRTFDQLRRLKSNRKIGVSG